MSSPHVFTVGHSDQEAESFVLLLKRYGIQAVVDVRSHPGSAWAPQFNRVPLRSLLKANNMRYAFMGDELGVRSKDPAHYEEGKIAYRRLQSSPSFQEGLLRLAKASTEQVLAVMCSEGDPLTCHRSVLIAPSLEQLNVSISHILRSGVVVEHSDLIDRLLSEEKLSQPDLFRPREERIEEALAKREEAIAWRAPAGTTSRDPG